MGYPGKKNERSYGISVSADVAAMTGLEIMQATCSGLLPAPPICQTLGFEMVEVDESTVVFEGWPALEYYNQVGCVHGGWAVTLLDSCMGCAVYTTLDAMSDCRTIELKINYTREILDDTGPLRAEGRVLHRGRRTATADGRLVDKDGRLFAHGSTTCLVFESPALR